MPAADRLHLKVFGVRCEARDVMVLDLRDPSGNVLPSFTAGAHLEFTLADGLIRHYSLCNDPAERHRYCVGVGLARESRGGSKQVHETMRVGSTVTVSAPRNNFPLDATAEEVVFVAGGIGITPIMAMIHNCQASGMPWRLFYCARNRQRTAFYEDLTALAGARCHFHFDDEQNGRLFDAASVLGAIDPSAHIYTCGPEQLMKAVETATASRAPDRVHFEWFTAAKTDVATDKSFTIVLRQSGTRYEVPPGRSILEVLEDHGAGVPYSCREGLCATCRTPVLSGEVDHRDNVLSSSEKAANKDIMICISRAKSDVLELNL